MEEETDRSVCHLLGLSARPVSRPWRWGRRERTIVNLADVSAVVRQSDGMVQAGLEALSEVWAFVPRPAQRVDALAKKGDFWSRVPLPRGARKDNSRRAS